MKSFHTSLAVLAIGLIGVLGSAVQADQTIDSFESYKAGQIIGKSWDSKPWRRFGHATNDNVVATGTDGKVISGRRSAEYGAFWPNRFGAIRYVFKEAKDLNDFAAASFKIRSDNGSTNTRVKIAVSDGDTTYIGAVGQNLTNKMQHFTFSIDPADMVLADGSRSYADVITNVTMIGMDFTSSEGQYTESIIFDDFELRDSLETTDSDW